MFNIDIIEADWKNNSFKLSEEEIIEIYLSEGATINKYFNDLKEYNKKTHIKMDATDRLLATIFGEYDEIKAKEQKLKEKYEEPKKIRLSEKNQKIVVEGCLDVVFDETRYWYDYFDENIDMEELYYICLKSLLNSVKYCLHNEKPTFRKFISKSIERNIIKYIAKLEQISYRDAWGIINYIEICPDDVILSDKLEKKKFSYDYTKESIEKPSKMYSYLKDRKYDVDFISNVSSNEFMADYNDVISSLDSLTIDVMRLIFDKYGNSVIPYKEISEYLGINPKKISRIKNKALKKIRNDERIAKYRP